MVAAAIEPWSTAIQGVMSTVHLLVGGLFGLYVIFFAVKIVLLRKMKKRLDAVEKNIEDMQGTLSEIQTSIKKTIASRPRNEDS